MSRNNLMSNLTQLHSIGNENIDEFDGSADPVPVDSDLPDGVAGEIPVERSLNDTNDAVLEEQHEDDVNRESDIAASESIAMLMDNTMRQSFALEELAEQLTDSIEGDGEGISPLQAQMITTGSEITDEAGSQIAVENFHINQRIATESLRDSIVEKAAMLKDTVMGAFKRVMRTVRNQVTYTLERVQFSGVRVLAYSKRSELLSETSGQEITDPKALARLRKHMPMDGKGNIEITRFIKSDCLGIARNVSSLIAVGNRTIDALTGNPDRVLDAIASFYKEVEKLKNTKPKSLDIQVNVPESFDIDSLLAAPAIKSIASVEVIVGSGEQTYTIVTKQELNSYVDLLTNMRSEINGISKAVLGNNGIIDFSRALHARSGIEGRDISVFKLIKLYNRSAGAIIRMISRLASDLAYITSRAARHVVLLVAASFEAAGVKPHAEDLVDAVQ